MVRVNWPGKHTHPFSPPMGAVVLLSNVHASPDRCLLLSHSGSSMRALLRLCSCSASHTGTSTICCGLNGPYRSCSDMPAQQQDHVWRVDSMRCNFASNNRHAGIKPAACLQGEIYLQAQHYCGRCHGTHPSPRGKAQQGLGALGNCCGMVQRARC